MIRFRYIQRVKFKKLLAGGLACVLLAMGPGAAAALAGETVSAEAEGGSGEQTDPAPSQPAQDPSPSQGETPSGQDPAPADPAGEEGQTGTGEGTQPEGTPADPADPAGQGGETAPGTGEEPAAETPAEQEEPAKTEEKKNERVEDEHELEQADLATGRNEDLFAGMTITSLPWSRWITVSTMWTAIIPWPDSGSMSGKTRTIPQGSWGPSPWAASCTFWKTWATGPTWNPAT